LSVLGGEKGPQIVIFTTSGAFFAENNVFFKLELDFCPSNKVVYQYTAFCYESFKEVLIMAAKKAKKTTAKKAKKTTAKKTTAKKVATKEQVKPVGFEKVSKARTKSQILAAISGATTLPKRDVNAVFEALGELIGHDLKKGPGFFTVPGLMKVVVVKKPATKARKGVNPFTGEEMMFKAKPARNVVKVRPLKGLKDKV
jgi:nucleoid DNA-binding protein